MDKQEETTCEFYLKRGSEKYKNKDYEDAIEDYNKAIELEPENVELFKFRSEIKTLIGDIKGAEIDKALSKFYGIDSENRIDYLKKSFIKLKKKQENKGIECINDSLLAVAKMDKEAFATFSKDKNIKIRSAVALNPYIPDELLSVLIEDNNIGVKLSVLKNAKCPKAILEKSSGNYENYSSSRLRKAVALNANTPSPVIKKLLKDEYRWVREAAAAHIAFKNKEITSLIPTTDRYILKGLVANPNCSKPNRDKINKLLEDKNKFPEQYNTYTLPSYIPSVEAIIESISIKELLEYGNGHNWFESYRDNYDVIIGTPFPLNNIQFNELETPDENYKFAVSGSKEKDYFKDVLKKASNGNLLIIGKMEWSAGYYKSYSIELENELKVEMIEAKKQIGVFTDYSYHKPDLDVYFEEGDDWEQTDGYISTEIYFVWNGKAIEIDDFEKILEEKEVVNTDTEDEESLRKFIIEKYKIENGNN